MKMWWNRLGIPSLLIVLSLKGYSGTPTTEVPPTAMPPMIMLTKLEIILPCVLAIAMMITGFLFLLIPAQWRRYKNRRLRRAATSPISISDIAMGTTLPLPNRTLLTPDDMIILEDMAAFFNKPRELIYISVPSFISLLLAPLLLMVFQPMTLYFWPPEVFPGGMPNINDALGCFLVPAGLVYAVTFGFTFQSAVEKLQTFSSNLTVQVSLLDQILHLTSEIKTDTKTKIKIYRATKEAAVGILLEMQSQKYKRKAGVQSLWKVVGYLRERCDSNCMDNIVINNIMDNIMKINTALSHVKDALSSGIHPIQWSFLISLSFFSFFGVLLIQGQSPRMNLCMCIVTVFSITLLTFVNADLDTPFSGFFKIDISPLTEVIKRVDVFYQEELEQGNDGTSTTLLSIE